MQEAQSDLSFGQADTEDYFWFVGLKDWTNANSPFCGSMEMARDRIDVGVWGS